MSAPQNYSNHTKWDPLFHFFLTPVMLITFLMTAYNVYADFRFGTIWLFLLTIAGWIAIVKTRLYSLRVQDRVIRLEERLRLQMVLPEELRTRIPELSERQLVALRFASDAELPSLVQQTLEFKLSNKEIKQRIQNWRADEWRV